MKGGGQRTVIGLSEEWKTGMTKIKNKLERDEFKPDANRKKVIIFVPKDRKDIDACIKFFLDGAEDYFYYNDSQVDDLHVTRWDEKDFMMECHDMKT